MRIICHGLRPEDFTVEFINHEITLGFSRTNQIPVKADGVSRHHAILIEDGNDLFIRDNESLNGTYLNGRVIRDRQRIFSGDTIQLGVQQIKAEFSSDQTVTLSFDPPLYGKSMPGQTDAKDPNGNADAQKPASRTEALFAEGREIGKYIIGKRIGKGGMGEIYLAKHKTLGIYRALKVLPKDMREDNAEFFERFIREAKLASEIRHHNVVGVMDVETDPSFGFPYIVMEYIDGGSLRSSLNTNKRLSEEQAVVIVEAVASALQAAEEHNIVHRDIKPDNIMFTKQGEVKLADLGIAKNGDIDNDLTRTNMIIGTPAYLPPEQAQNAKHVDCRADIYSLGATFYEMLTGELPYPGNNTFEIIHKLVTDPVPDPRKINPEISPASAAIVMKMMAKDAKDRFQNAGELLEMMDRTFPPHTAYETAELIKKVLAGECENSAAFSSEIALPKTESGFGRFCKWVCLSVICFCCFASAFYFCTKIRLPAIHFSSTAQNADGNSLEEDEPEITKKDEEPETAAPVQPELYDLQITTTPNSEISFIDGDGRLTTYRSDDDGHLKITGLRPGSYKVEISRKNFLPLKREINLEGNMEINALMTADLQRLIILAQPGSEVRITGTENGEKRDKVSSDGQAVFYGLIKETIWVCVELAGWKTVEQTLPLTGDKTLEIKQERIVFPLSVQTEPFANVSLLKNGRIAYSASANIMGRAVIDSVAADQYKVVVTCSGFHDYEDVCDLEKDRPLNIKLQKITYELTIKAEPETNITLFLNQKQLETCLVPESGILTLPNMEPGKYSFTAMKNGRMSKVFEFDLVKDSIFECFMTDDNSHVVVETPDASKTEASQNPKQTAVAEPDKEKADAGQNAEEEILAAETTSGTITVFWGGSQELWNYIQDIGVDISIGDHTESGIRKFPWTYQLKAGDYRISIRGEGLKVFQPNVTITADKDSAITFNPDSEPPVILFESNQEDTVITFNGGTYKPGDQVPCEAFQEQTATGVSGRKRIPLTIQPLTPGSRQTVRFTFSGNNHPMQEQYLEGLALFNNEAYTEALEKLLPVAEADHVDAAKLVAEIYERRRSLWSMFSIPADAVKWYKKAADLGDPESALKVADAIYNGDLKGSDARQMMKYYLKAQVLGKAEIYYKISNLYKDGYKDLPKNDPEAVKFLMLAADKGLAEAMFDLGVRYEKGHGVSANTKLALEWISKAADKDYPPAKRYRRQLKQ